MSSDEQKSYTFKLKGEDDFKKRANSVFDSLQTIEKRYDKNVPRDEEQRPSQSSRYIGRNRDNFRERGGRPYSRRRLERVPDHVLRPDRYTKYRYDGFC